MSESANFKLPIWAIVVIVVLSIIGIVFALWGVMSSFYVASKQKVNKKTNWAQHFRKKPSFSLNEIFNYKQGVYAITFKGINVEDFFIPVYIFTTDNLGKEITKLISEINEDRTHKIKNYMDLNDIEFNRVVIIQLFEEKDNQKMKEWIKKIDSKNRGFN
ncbi:hypothetical protein [Mesoplasma corruscae]|uniref:Uncharacterized protein n=1 Tax=Mesoplasma corruscae TaxID=216874 RepID=A0A2S5RGN0_9MOLU|nr:hypothetical protein [Mesoplasma corruscae]PPE06460.1 hypothetical protein MCORR_v1c00880 [Mesoplasma corruscae]